MWTLLDGRMVWVAAPDEPPAGGGGSDDVDDESENEDNPLPDPPAEDTPLLTRIKDNPVRTEKELLDLRHENESLRKKQRDIEAEQEAARTKALEDREEYKTLYTEANTELETVKARVTELEAELEGYRKSDTERLGTLAADLPDHLRELVEKMSPREALMWIEAHEDEIRKPRPPNTDAGASGDNAGKQIKPAFEPRVRL